MTPMEFWTDFWLKSLPKPAVAPAWTGVNPLQAWSEYWIDACQRTVLVWDVMRRRGNAFLDHEDKGKPPVLSFQSEMVMDGRTLPAPGSAGYGRARHRECAPGGSEGVMESIDSLNELRVTGRMRWIPAADGWSADADDVMRALARDGFEECRHEEARSRRHHARNGVWQGLNRSTGCVASAVWVASDHRQQLVFIDIDGEPLRCQGSARSVTP